MKKLHFGQLDGWPASTETWRYFQEMIEQVQALSLLGGDNYIISGCVENGNNVTSGWVVLNGEILPFEGGLKQDKMVAVQIETVKEFFGGILLPYYIDRKAIFGSGDGEVEWAGMKRNNPANSILQRLDRLERIAAPFLPVIDPGDQSVHRGGMVLWKKPAILIPAGWQEVVDWRGRLPLGFDPTDPAFNEVGKPGGGKSHTLQAANLASHSHSFKDRYYVEKDIGTVPKKELMPFNYNNKLGSGDTDTDNNYFLYLDAQTDNAGSSVPVDHMNPFRIVLFIEYTGD